MRRIHLTWHLTHVHQKQRTLSSLKMCSRSTSILQWLYSIEHVPPESFVHVEAKVCAGMLKLIVLAILRGRCYDLS
jgi:hypothetical protein